jgi:hypothetical protein
MPSGIFPIVQPATMDWTRPAHMNNEEWKQEWMKRVREAKPITPLPEGYWPEEGEKLYSRKKQLKQQKKARLQQKASAKNTNNFFQQKQNEDGYPMKLCTYEPLEKRFVYRPPGYGVNSAGGKHCCDCHLKPCVAEEYRDETSDFFFNLQIVENKPDLVAQEKTLVFLHRKYCKAIKRRYLKKLKPPQCIPESVAGFSYFFRGFEEHDEEEEAGEEAGDETEFRFDYGDGSFGNETDEDDNVTLLSLHRDHECGDAPVEETKNAQQQAVTKSLVKDDRKRKSIQEWLEESSDEENEF